MQLSKCGGGDLNGGEILFGRRTKQKPAEKCGDSLRPGLP